MRAGVVSGAVAVGSVLLLVAAAVLVGPTRTVAGTAGPAPGGSAPVSPAVPGVGEGAAGLGDEYFPVAGNGGYDVLGYEIDLRYDPAGDRLEGTTVVTATATEDLRRFNLDLRLAATAVTVNDRDATIDQGGGELVVTPAAPLRAGEPMRVTVDYAGVPSTLPAPDDPISPWFRTPDGAVAVGQPHSAAWWFPSNDHPSDKATVTVSATVPTGVEVISGGVLVAGPEPVEGGDRWQWATAQPMATYLAFVAIGQYTVESRDTAAGPFVAAYAETLPPQVTETARAAIDRSAEVVEVLAEMFGPYPFEQIGGVVPGDLGFALETQTRPVYSSGFFEGGSISGDGDGNSGIDEGLAVVVHELAHQWFGDSVSVRRWRDIWLNEGFATYAEWFYDERTGGPTAQERALREYEDVPAGSTFWTVAPGDPGPEALFDDAVYVRGGLAVHAIRVAVGDEAFLALLQAWTAERAGGNATVEDFLELAERESGVDLDAVAQDWLYDTDRPDRPPG